MPCSDGDVEINSPPNAPAATSSPQNKLFTDTPEKGRIGRRRKSTPNAKKSNDGPVLRATVKPVKRFTPQSNPNNGEYLCNNE